MHPARRILLALVVLTAFSRPAFAAWPHDPANGTLPICTGPNDQSAPQSISDGAGGAFFCWNGTLGNDIFVQHVSATGTVLWTTNGLPICTAGAGQGPSALCSDGAGGILVAWVDFRGGTGDIYAQRVNAAGVPQWTTDGVIVCNATADQLAVQIASDGSGGALLTWTDARSGGSDIYVQRVNSVGASLWTGNGVLVCNAANDQTVPQIVSDGAGGAIVVWMDQRAGVGVFDVWGQRVNAAGTPQWTANGLAFCPATGNQLNPKIVADGLGGVITTWYDGRSGAGNDIYAQHTTASGTMLWNGNGAPICTATNEQNVPQLVADGSGGAVIAWTDYRNGGVQDVYAQRINTSGSVLWTANGVPVSTFTLTQFSVAIASDGAQGAVIAWVDLRGFTWDVYAQRVSANGTPLWTTDGVPVCTALGNQQQISIVPDAAAGAIVSWQDPRAGTETDIYAERVDRYGQLGSPEPSIVNVRDVPGDQGGKVSVAWNASYLAGDPYGLVTSYWLWRQAPRALAMAALGRGARLLVEGETPGTSATGLWKTTVTAGQTFYWEYLGSQVAQGFAGYSYLASTTSDSASAGNPRTYFLVEAKSSGTANWSSAPDSGYSVDNLAPATPAPFTGAYAAGVATLHWNPNAEADLAEYRLYRGSSSSFVPGPGNFVTAQPDTGYADAAGAPYYYKLAAVDVHGNVSPFALLLPSGTVAVDPVEVARSLDFALAGGNPVHGAAELRLVLPRAARVSVVLFDARGRRVRELAAGWREAGEQRLAWDGRDARGGAAPSGLYFARLAVAGTTRTLRFTLLR